MNEPFHLRKLGIERVQSLPRVTQPGNRKENQIKYTSDLVPLSEENSFLVRPSLLPSKA